MGILRRIFHGVAKPILASICFSAISIISLDEVFAGPKKIEVKPFPVIEYSTETSLGLGALAVVTWREQEGRVEDRPDSLSVVFYYTLKNQLFITATPDFYFNDQKGEIRFSASYSNIPTSYFGIGNEADIDKDEFDALEEPYTNESTALGLSLLHKMYQKFRLGMNYHLSNSRLFDKEEDSRIDEDQLNGREDGLISGIGPVIDWDSRDNSFYPSSGGWYQFGMISYRDWLGSDFDYDRFTIDLRHFFTIKPNHIIAIQAIAEDISGDVPFYELASPQIRGFDSRFFVDKKMVSSQVEYRFPITGRFSGTAFLGIGDV
ncbi:MAG: BamA/TamA family outer membrane protein, partial [Deltaproteobacteria bacterium]|nr:BamA/TamA family outer membrane protein [Deltaproteobacteria bacterium]